MKGYIFIYIDGRFVVKTERASHTGIIRGLGLVRDINQATVFQYPGLKSLVKNVEDMAFKSSDLTMLYAESTTIVRITNAE